MDVIINSVFGGDNNYDITKSENEETSITYKNSAGYIDVGLSNNGDLSFHVRNDCNPHLSSYGDIKWDGKELPSEFLTSAALITGHTHKGSEIVNEFLLIYAVAVTFWAIMATIMVFKY